MQVTSAAAVSFEEGGAIDTIAAGDLCGGRPGDW